MEIQGLLKGLPTAELHSGYELHFLIVFGFEMCKTELFSTLDGSSDYQHRMHSDPFAEQSTALFLVLSFLSLQLQTIVPT